MGLAVSAAGSYVDVFRMPTDMEIDFQKMQLDQYAVVQQEAQRGLLANLVGIGALGGAGGAMTAYGSSWRVWETVSWVIAEYGWVVILLCLALALPAGFARWGEGAIFSTVAVGVFFLTYQVIYYSSSGKMYMITYKPALASLIFALIVASVVTFAVYKRTAEKDKDNEQMRGDSAKAHAPASRSIYTAV